MYHEHVTGNEVPYLINYDTLLQNATDIITKCEIYFITKCDINLLQNASDFLLQNTIALLKNTTVITNCESFITKCDSCYKMRRLFQIAAIHIDLFHERSVSLC